MSMPQEMMIEKMGKVREHFKVHPEAFEQAIAGMSAEAQSAAKEGHKIFMDESLDPAARKEKMVQHKSGLSPEVLAELEKMKADLLAKF